MSGGHLVVGWVLVAVLGGCGGARREAEAPAAARGDEAGEAASGETQAESRGATLEAKSAAAAEPASSTVGLPTECMPSDELCLPPRAFVQRLCRDAYAGAAVVLFEKSSPFSRGYVRSREVKSVNTLGGPASDVSLRFAEEVVILTRSAGAKPGEMQVSGMGGYDVLRWDGTCATLAEEELATRPPAAPGHAPFAWRYIDTNIQDALLLNAGIAAARRSHRKHCHGVTLGRISPACAKAEAELQDSVVAAVRAGLALPVPERLP